MIVIDASALVAILANEPDGLALSDRLAEYPQGPGLRSISTTSVWEAACAVSRIWRVSREMGLSAIQQALATGGIEPVAPDMAITALAIEAAERFGIGPGYPGILNFGDCFSYATAKRLGAALLFKGDDFARTDVTPA